MATNPKEQNPASEKSESDIDEGPLRAPSAPAALRRRAEPRGLSPKMAKKSTRTSRDKSHVQTSRQEHL